MKYEHLSDDIKNDIKNEYLNTYSVAKVKEIICSKYNITLGRAQFENFLKSIGVYEGLNGPNYLRKKVENHVEYLQQAYGVSNWGQMPNNGFKRTNKIPYKKLQISKNFEVYLQAVDKRTRQNIKVLKRQGLIPSLCAYTGIRFADGDGDVNPNDPRKRSVDHIFPITYCFLTGKTIEEAADVSNIRFVLRIVNSMKSNTLYESFEPMIPIIKKAFADEGY